jgi:heme exporter protein C
MGLHAATDEPRKAARAMALLVLVGVVNLPIIHYSVQWWNTLHQPASIGVSGSSIHASMLWPLLIMAVAAKFYYLANLLTRARTRLLEQDRRKNWVRQVLLPGEAAGRDSDQGTTAGK